jgi:hypothetical protein
MVGRRGLMHQVQGRDLEKKGMDLQLSQKLENYSTT